MIINRDLNIWDATYVGFVSDSLFEKWRFEFSEAHSFVINASPITGGLAPTTLWWNLSQAVVSMTAYLQHTCNVFEHQK